MRADGAAAAALRLLLGGLHLLCCHRPAGNWVHAPQIAAAQPLPQLAAGSHSSCCTANCSRRATTAAAANSPEEQQTESSTESPRMLVISTLAQGDHTCTGIYKQQPLVSYTHCNLTLIEVTVMNRLPSHCKTCPRLTLKPRVYQPCQGSASSNPEAPTCKPHDSHGIPVLDDRVVH